MSFECISGLSRPLIKSENERCSLSCTGSSVRSPASELLSVFCVLRDSCHPFPVTWPLAPGSPSNNSEERKLRQMTDHGISAVLQNFILLS